MAILQQCPICRKRQGLSKKTCSCGEDLQKARRSDRVKFFVAYYLPDGKAKCELMGTSLDKAKTYFAKITTDKRERPETLHGDRKKTFSELTEWYLTLEKVRGLRRFKTVKIRLDKFNSVLGDMPVARLKPADLENYQAKRKKEGMADSTIDDEITSARTMVNRAFLNYIVSGDCLRPFAAIDKMLVKDSNARDRIITPEEFRKLVDHSAGHLRPVLVTAYFTGMRKSEILGLTWDRVNLEQRSIILDPVNTKTRRGRTIPICRELHETLSALSGREQGGFVFTYEGKPLGEVKKSFISACKAAGLPYGRKTRNGLTLHDMRHSFTTYLRKAGIAIPVRMKLTGHETGEMDRRYDKVDLGDLQKAMDSLEAYLGSNDHLTTNTQKATIH